MELGLIKKVDIDAEMQQSYLDYAMSVIVARALPDARDGLKPVQRRILYAMYDMGLRPDSAYKKSARIVGEVLGKYHPHGDMAVYEAMARMAQDFSMRYPLVAGQGNFGSVDGDPPAAMRYTEARLAPIAIDLLNQIEKNTVDFARNFDDSLDEPVVLPAAIPNLIVNGATGIAVGMATNIPPHNLSEVIDALVFMLERWDQLDDIPIEALMRFIQGPDFPTGGVIIQDPQADGLSSAYASGRGRVIVQARARLEEMDRGRSRIIVTELPYTVNKASLIERIAELVREGTVEGISDLRDESDRHGMRIVIEVSKTADPQRVLRDLYHRTPMKTTFGINLLALVEGEPRLLSLKQALRVYLEHRLVVVKRRSEYDLAKAKQRAHILEGLRIALQHLDELIALIRGAADVDQARQRMMKRFKLSELQAQAILEMQLRRLAALERKKIEQEYKETIALIKTLEALLRSPKRMRQAVIDELVAMKEQYGDRRRTQIAQLKEGETLTNLLTTTDLTPDQDVWISITEGGRVTRTLDEQMPSMGGQDGPRWLMRASTHALIYLVSTNGRAAALPVHVIPDQVAQPNGVFVHQLTPLKEDDPLAFVFQLPAGAELKDEDFLITISRQGLVKKSLLSELPGPAAQAFQAARVNQGDSLGWGLLTHGRGEILLATRQGMAIRFLENVVRPMGLVAAGVGGIKLANGDEIIGAVEPQKDQEILLIASDGRAKRVPLKDFPLQSRYGQGVIAWKLARGLELVGIGTGTGSSQFVVHLSKGGSQQVRISDAAPATRAGQGKSLVDVNVGDYLLELVPIHQAPDGIDSLPLAGRQRRKPKASTNGHGANNELTKPPRSREKSPNALKGKTVKPPVPSTKDGKVTITTKTSRNAKASTSSPAKPVRRGRIQAKTATKPSVADTPKSTRKSKSVTGETVKPKAQPASTVKHVATVPMSKVSKVKSKDGSSSENKKKSSSSRNKLAQPELPGLENQSSSKKSTPRPKKKGNSPEGTPPAKAPVRQQKPRKKTSQTT